MSWFWTSKGGFVVALSHHSKKYMLRALWLWGNIYRKNSSRSCFKGSMGRKCPAFGHKILFCITLQQSHWMQSEIKRLSGHHIHGCLERKRMWAGKMKSKSVTDYGQAWYARSVWQWNCPQSRRLPFPGKKQLICLVSISYSGCDRIWPTLRKCPEKTCAVGDQESHFQRMREWQ